jgi:type 1 glutamine amidotransferase
MAFELQYNRARVFNTTMGHDVTALKVPGTAELIRRGTAWAAGILKEAPRSGAAPDGGTSIWLRNRKGRNRPG